MATTIATVTADGLSLTPEVMEAFSLRPGSQVRISIEPPELAPIHPEAKRLVEKMMGMFSGSPSLSEELKKERREEDLRSRW